MCILAPCSTAVKRVYSSLHAYTCTLLRLVGTWEGATTSIAGSSCDATTGLEFGEDGVLTYLAPVRAMDYVAEFAFDVDGEHIVTCVEPLRHRTRST